MFPASSAAAKIDGLCQENCKSRMLSVPLQSKLLLQILNLTLMQLMTNHLSNVKDTSFLRRSKSFIVAS